MEFDIPDGVELRIPYPLEQSIEEYRNGIETYKKLYK
jgi:hypothetical protein